MASKSFDDTFIGTVVKYNKDTREVAVYIPRLMPSLYDGEATDYKVPTNSGLRITTTNTNISSTITKTNYIWIRPRNMDDPIPDIGSKVYVTFLDDRPSMGLWWKCNINGDYTVIPEERYERQFSIDINNSPTTIYRDDTLIVNLPDYFRVTSSDSGDEKIPTYNIRENYNFYKSTNLEESITNLQKSMEYIESEYKTTFLNNIDTIEFEPTGFAPISFPQPITEYLGAPRVEDDKLNSFRLYLNSELDDIYRNVGTLYPALYRQEIIDRIRNTKHALGMISEPNDIEYWQIIRQFYTWLEQYNFDLGGFLTNSFSKIRSKSKTQIKLSQNLLDCSEIYTQYNYLLQGLKDTYTLFNTYITKYNNISNTTLLQSLADQSITKDNIENNILTAFERAYDSVDINSIKNYITYIKTLFPSTVKVTYVYSDNGLTNNILETIDTEKLFEVYGSTLYEPDTEIIPTEVPEPDATLAYDCTIYDWVTENDNISITNNYYLVQDIRVKPQMLFGAIVYDNDEFDLLVWDNIPNSTKTYKYYINNTEKTLAQVKEYISDITHTDYTVKVLYEATNTEVNITYNNTVFYKNIVDGLTREIDSMDNAKTTDGFKEVYGVYEEYENLISAYNLTKANIKYTDNANTEHTYTEQETRLKDTYGAYATTYINDLIDNLPNSYDPEYDNDIFVAKDTYDYYHNLGITLSVDSDRMTKLNTLYSAASA